MSFRRLTRFFFFFFFNDTATTEIYTLSLHDALPIFGDATVPPGPLGTLIVTCVYAQVTIKDRKSTRLNSSHGYISYAVFCLKKKKKSEAHHPVPPHRNHSPYNAYAPIV